MATVKRAEYIADSNNAENANKNICALAVADMFGVADSVRYLHTMSDLVKAVRTRFTVRSRRSTLKGETVGQLRKSIVAKGDAICYMVRVDNHVILLNKRGETVVDTAPRERDRRTITHVYGVYK